MAPMKEVTRILSAVAQGEAAKWRKELEAYKM